jgi:hypothetical protein
MTRTVRSKGARKKRRLWFVRPEIEMLEARCLLDSGFRTITEVGNNVANSAWGASNTDLLRVSPVAYADGLNAPSQPNTLSPRVISNSLDNQSNPIFSGNDTLGNPNSQSLSDYAYAWGQFIDHDMDLTLDNSGQAFNIGADSGTFGTNPDGTPITDKMGVEGFTRSQFDPATGPSAVNLAGVFNRVGIVKDGSTFTGGGLDADGNALSANLLGSSFVFNWATYTLGAPGVKDVVSAAGQTINLPADDASISFLATGVNGNQPNLTFKVTYTDGSTQTFTQSISDWFTPQNYKGESNALTMNYRDTANGGKDSRAFHVYAYSFNVDTTKHVKSITLPDDKNVEVLAIDVTPDSPRQQVNAVTSYLDLSQVYGSTNVVADALRTHSGGLLKTSPGNLLPFNSTAINPLTNEPYFTQAQLDALNMANDAHQVTDDKLFAAGDRRANENVELMSLTTLFVRNHNRIAAQLAQQNPANFGFTSWTDENLYQEARKLNIAEEEMITYNGYLPSILGPNALPAYTGYQNGVNAGIATEFSTVGFRFGHSLLSSTVGRDQNNGNGINDPNGSTINLTADFFDPNLITANGAIDPLTGHTSTDIGPILKALSDGLPNETDLLLIDEVRNVLFGIPNAPGTDLAARDIQRARDHGIGTYNQVREAYGLSAVTSFADITSDATVQNELRATYGTLSNGQDNVDAVDPFIGMLAEDHVAGADVGPTVQAILAKQFAALRDGDRFFYLNESFTTAEKNIIAQGNTLAKVIKDNTSITNLQSNVFFNHLEISGVVFNDLNGDGIREFGEPGLAGVTVNLNDPQGRFVSSTTTDANGEYDFTDQVGIPATGDYTLQVIPRAGFTQNATEIAHNPGTIHLSRGDLAIDGQNFALMRTSPAAPSCGGGSPAAASPADGTTTSGTSQATDADLLPTDSGTQLSGDGAVDNILVRQLQAPASTGTVGTASTSQASGAATQAPDAGSAADGFTATVGTVQDASTQASDTATFDDSSSDPLQTPVV